MKMEEEGLQFLYLSEPDMLEAGVLDMKQCVKTIEDMFRLAGKGDYIMGGPKRDSHGIMLWWAGSPLYGYARLFGRTLSCDRTEMVWF